MLRGRCALASCGLAAIALALMAAAGRAGEAPPERLTAATFRCPTDAERRDGPSPRDGGTALWCETVLAGETLRHGPYLELAADGSAVRRGRYDRGLQAGEWLSFGPRGEVLESTRIWPGEAGPHLPEPQELCPPDARRVRSYGHDHEERMWSRCLRRGADGALVQVGPRVTWSAERLPDRMRYRLRDVTEYEDDRPHGRHLVYAGESGREVLIVEERYADGKLAGESRAFYEDGGLREVRFYRAGALAGARRAFYPGGAVRWVARYDSGRLISAEGDLTVAGQRCPDGHLPMASSDGLEEYCARRTGRTPYRHGAYAVRDGAGRVVERGIYYNGKKADGWQMSPAELELSEALAARGRLMVGERPLSEITAVEPSLWFRDRESQEYLQPEREIDGDEVRIFGLAPGHYHVGLVVDADPGNPERHPGDLTGSHDFRVVEDEVTELELRLRYTLHLTEPWNNRRPIPGWAGPCWERPVLTTPARFAWRAPGSEEPGWIEYRYKLWRYGCDPTRRIAIVAEGTTYDTSVVLELPPNRRAELYLFELGGHRAGIPIGQLMTFGDNGGHGWDLRFRVAGSAPAR